MPRFGGEPVAGGRFGGDPIDDVSLGSKVGLSIGQGFNIGLAKGAGFMVDAATSLINILPGVDIKKPIGGSQQLQELFSEYGLTPALGEEVPIPVIGRVAEELGAAVVPFGVAGTAARTSVKGGKLAAPILEAFRTAPKATAVGEISSATGAGVGAAAAQEVFPESPVAEFVGQLVGGFAAPGALAADVVRTPSVKRGAKKIIEPFLPGGAKRSAARQLAKIADDPREVLDTLTKKLDAVPGARLTPAQETGDRGLLQLEKALSRADPDIEQFLNDALSATTRAIRGEAEDISGLARGQAREFLENRIQSINNTIDDSIKNALTKAKSQIEGVAPGTSREQLSIIARDHIDAALQKAKLVEKTAWKAVPSNVTASLSPLKKIFRELKKALPKAQREDMPDVALRLLGRPRAPSVKIGAKKVAAGVGLKNIETIKEIQGLRSKLLAVARNSRSGDASNFNKARIADELADAALNVMEKTDAGDSLRDALTVTKVIKNRFQKGPVGKVLGIDRRGGLATPAEQTLDRLIAREGVEGGVNMDALIRATSHPNTRDVAADFMRHRFIMASTDASGKVSRGSAVRFLRRNKEILDRMPELRKELSLVKNAQELSERTQKVLLGRKRSIMDKRKSRAALYIDAPVGREIRTLLNSKNPPANMTQLVKQTSKDRTGGALRGLKAQFVDEMLTQAEKKSGLSARNMEEFFKKNSSIIKNTGLFNSNEISRLKKMVKTATKVEGRIISGRRVGEILDESPDAVTDLVARIVGANIGAKGAAGATGAPIVAAGAGARFARNITNKMPFEKTRDVLAEAILDRNVMMDLLRQVETPREADKLTRRINGWMINLLTEEDSEELSE